MSVDLGRTNLPLEDRPWMDLDAPERPLPEHIPIAFRWNGHAIPDLAQIDERDWVGVLKTLRRPIQAVAVNTAPGGVSNYLYNHMALFDRPPPISKAVERAVSSPLGVPSPKVPGRPRRRQVNFRIEHDEYDRLREAARRLGVRPTELARLFTMSGVNRALEDLDSPTHQ